MNSIKCGALFKNLKSFCFSEKRDDLDFVVKLGIKENKYYESCLTILFTAT